MASRTSSLWKPFSFSLFLLLPLSLCFMYSVYAQNLPTPTIAKVFNCFNNRLNYNQCNEEYRLNESGELHVPTEATELFCSGPCLRETESALNCVDNVLSNFIFFNGATVRAIRNAIHNGCSNNNQRGNFNVGQFLFGDGNRVSSSIFFTALALMLGSYGFIFELVGR